MEDGGTAKARQKEARVILVLSDSLQGESMVAFLGRLFRSKDPPGYYKGKHYSEWPPMVRQLKRDKKLDDAEKLLWELVHATESEAIAKGCVAAPWSYDELAKIYRSRKDYGAEIAILERYVSRDEYAGASTPKLIQRLARARELQRKG
jgi:hypothetical protein